MGAKMNENSRSPSKSKHPFRKTKKLLSRLENDFLRCVKCGVLPVNGIYSLKQCDHKYCAKCVKCIKESQMCLVCDVRIKSHDVNIDSFYMRLMQRIQKFKHAVESNYP